MAVQEIIKNKKYKIDVPLGYNGTKRIRHIETFYGGKKEAILRENEIKLELKNNTYVKKNHITMQSLIEEWLKMIKCNVQIKTYKAYELYSKNIIKYIGHVKLKNLNVKILEEFYNNLRNDTTYADKTIKHHYAIISNVLNTAIRWGYINSNPNMFVTPIKVHKKEIECYSPEEVKKLIDVLQNEPIKYQAIILLALDSGCRRGEITGLTWEDIDFKNCSININKTTQYVPDYGIFEKEPKSETSNRIIYIAPTTIQLLKAYQKRQNERKLLLGTQWKNSKRVFTTEYGSDMHPDTPSKILEKIIKKYNLKRITFHGLRHTSISLQISSGIQSQIVSKRAGHSSVAVTDNIYSHFFKKDLKKVANKIDSFLQIKTV